MIEIKPLGDGQAVVSIPGSKSFTHRALIVSALAAGESVLHNALRSEDTERTVEALEKFGIPLFWEGNSLRVRGGGGDLAEGEKEIGVGESGTSMRFLTALAALRRGRTFLDGGVRMRQRPIGDLLDGLRALGGKAYAQEGNGYPPVVVESQVLRGGLARIKSSRSSQFLSALLMVAPYAQSDVCLEVDGPLASQPYVDITQEVMAAFGVDIGREGDRSFLVRAGRRYLARKYQVEGDSSNASYFLAAAAVTGARITVENFRPASVQGDSGFLSILEKMGCRVRRGENFAEVQGMGLRAIDVDMNRMPDVVPTLAVTASFARGRTTICNIGHLRLKESDRIGALAGELRKMGIYVEEGEDWLKVEGGEPRGAEIETHNDHRLAMSLAIAGLAVPGVKIKGEKCVEKSFPDFWKTLEKLY